MQQNKGVIVVQLAQRSLLTLEIRRSNPNIGKNLSANCKIQKRRNKEKEAGIGPFKKEKYATQTWAFEDVE